MDFERPNARMVYRVLNGTLHSTMGDSGYKRVSGTQGAWAKRLDEGYLVVVVSASRWGWNELTGSTVEFGLRWSPAATETLDDSTRFVSAEEAYGDDLLLELQAAVRQFVTEMPSISEEEFYEHGLGNRSDWALFRDMRKPPQLPALQQVLFLPYYRPEHLLALAEWLADHQAVAERRSLIALGRRVAGEQ